MASASTFSRNVRRGLNRTAVAAAAMAVVAGPWLDTPGARAGAPTFQGGTSSTQSNARFDHIDRSGGDRITFAQLLPRSGVPFPRSNAIPLSPYQFVSNDVRAGGSSSRAVASIGHVTDSVTAGLALGTGTGVSQTDPGNQYGGSSVLRIQLPKVEWVTGSTFGPTATGFFSTRLGGVLAPGASATFRANLNWQRVNADGSTTNLRSPWTTAESTRTFTNAGGSALDLNTLPSTQTTVTTSRTLSGGSIPTGTRIRLSGFLEYEASAGAAPILSSAPGDLRPLAVDPPQGEAGFGPIHTEFSSAPPTSTFVPNVAFINEFGPDSHPWESAENWDADRTDQSVTPSFPNGVGQRARFIHQGETPDFGPIHVDADGPKTLNSLLIDNDNSYVLSASNLTMATEAYDPQTENGFPASIAVRNVYGDSAHALATPVTLAAPLEIVVDSLGGLDFDGPVSDDGKNFPIEKFGDGSVRFNDPNNQLGGPVFVREGIVGGVGLLPGLLVVDNFAQISPGGEPGTLTVGSLQTSENTGYVFDLGDDDDPAANDLLKVDGTLVLDGVVDVRALTGFGLDDGTTESIYDLIRFEGALTNNGLILGNVPVDNQ